MGNLHLLYFSFPLITQCKHVNGLILQEVTVSSQYLFRLQNISCKAIWNLQSVLPSKQWQEKKILPSLLNCADIHSLLLDLKN